MEKDVKNLMESLGITEAEARELVEFDKGNIENDEVDKLEEKEKKEKKPPKKKGDSLAKVKMQKAKKKVDKSKEEILSAIENLVDNNEIFVNAQKLTATKFTFKDKEGNYFTISLTKHKVIPDGYKEGEQE